MLRLSRRICLLGRSQLSRGIRTTSDEHPDSVFKEDEKLLEKIQMERAQSDDLPLSMVNPFEKEKRQCILCRHDIKIDWKNVRLLSQFTSSFSGQLLPRHITGLCKKQQEVLEREWRFSTSFGFMPFVVKEVEFLKDPLIADPDRPVRPHSH